MIQTNKQKEVLFSMLYSIKSKRNVDKWDDKNYHAMLYINWWSVRSSAITIMTQLNKIN